LERVYWWSANGGCDQTIDRLIGIVADRVTTGVRQMCCRVAVSQQGFAKASEHLKNLAQISISHERLRVIVESEGRQVMKVQSAGLLEPGFSVVDDCKVSPDGPSRVYAGVDGVKVPMVTAGEKLKRRKGRGRRKKRCISVGRMHRGADNAYKEFKIATIYDQLNEHRHVIATSGNHEVLGRLVRRQAARLGVGKADQKIAIVDGAEWIAKQLNSKLPMLDAVVLDFYHLSEHVWLAAHKCFGQGSDRAKEFVAAILHIARHQGAGSLLAAVQLERKKYRTAGKRKALDELIGYVGHRASMCDYPTYEENGWQIGSGPTEAMCKVLTYRLKGSGMRWDRHGADAMMALVALQQSNMWKSYWDGQKHAA